MTWPATLRARCPVIPAEHADAYLTKLYGKGPYGVSKRMREAYRRIARGRKEVSKVSLNKKCAAWNAKHPVGAKVTVNLDSGEVRETVTRSPAEVLSGHSAVIWLEGISGCYLLDRVSPVQP